MTAVITVNGKEYTAKVAKKEDHAGLGRKTEMKVGRKGTTYDGQVEFEVIACEVTEVLRGRDTANSKQYTGTKPFVDLVLKITNNMQGADDVLSHLFGYVIVDGEILRADTRIETENNTALESFTGIELGQAAYVHVVATAEENRIDSAIRFNFGENCYYCNIA